MQNKYSHTPLMGTQIGTIALKNSLEVSAKSERIHTLWPQNSTLRFILNRNSYMHTERHRLKIFVTPLFIRVKNWNQSKYLLLVEWINKMCYMYATECYTAMK